ncbi:metallophosphoesterase family protein, partial [Patescibacteria group bacterium]|nr:metallophosphoesterase family protein [Patescibacteria group bacterium]
MKLGFISDIHEDIKRLEQALKILKSHKCDKIICLGDIVGYSVPYYGFLWSRNAPEVIKLVKKNCDLVVVGNHDLFAIKKLPKNKAGFKYPKDWYALDYWKRKTLSKDKVWLYEYNELPSLLTKADEKFIDRLPEYIVGNFDGVKILLSHY